MFKKFMIVFLWKFSYFRMLKMLVYKICPNCMGQVCLTLDSYTHTHTQTQLYWNSSWCLFAAFPDTNNWHDNHPHPQCPGWQPGSGRCPCGWMGRWCSCWATGPCCWHAGWPAFPRTAPGRWPAECCSGTQSLSTAHTNTHCSQSHACTYSVGRWVSNLFFFCTQSNRNMRSKHIHQKTINAVKKYIKKHTLKLAHLVCTKTR